MRRYQAYRWRSAPALAVILVTFIIRPVLAATSNWTTDTGGDFSNSANWDNGVPGLADTAVFRRGNVAYDVQFTGDIITDKLRVGTNTVNFKPSSNDGTYSLANLAIATDKGIIVGELSNDTAVLNSRLPAFTASSATIGQSAGSNGTFNVLSGDLKLTGTTSGFTSIWTLIVGDLGLGRLNISNGSSVHSNQNAVLGRSTGSIGLVTVDGTGTLWSNSQDIEVGGLGTGDLEITNGGQINCRAAYVAAMRVLPTMARFGSTAPVLLGRTQTIWVTVNLGLARSSSPMGATPATKADLLDQAQ